MTNKGKNDPNYWQPASIKPEYGGQLVVVTDNLGVLDVVLGYYDPVRNLWEDTYSQRIINPKIWKRSLTITELKQLTKMVLRDFEDDK